MCRSQAARTVRSIMGPLSQDGGPNEAGQWAGSYYTLEIPLLCTEKPKTLFPTSSHTYTALQLRSTGPTWEEERPRGTETVQSFRQRVELAE